jgi:hypothetical protein
MCVEICVLSAIDATAVALLSDGRRRYDPIKPALRARLSRRFPAGDRKRVLFVHIDDQIAWPQFYPFFHYADRFAEQGYAFRTVPYPAAGAEHLVREASAIFLQSPYTPAPGELEGVLERLRSQNPRAPISYFDWYAPTDARFADRVGDYVSFYAKKALQRDRDYYRVPQRAHTALEDYYSNIFDLVPDEPDWECRSDIAERLVLAPGFATAPVLLKGFERRSAAPSGERTIDVHARFAVAAAQLHAQGRVDAGPRSHWYGKMRQQARDAVTQIAPRYNFAWQGRVKSSEFMAEMERSKLCFSPFGFGELCWRDLEAILTGAVLVKPSMEHVDCFCDIFRPGETYVPVRWDLSDLDETIADLLAKPDYCRAMAAHAFDVVKDYLAGPRLGELLDQLCATRL